MEPTDIGIGRKYRDASGGIWRVLDIDGQQVSAAKPMEDGKVTAGMSLHLFAQLMTREIE